MTDLTLGKNNVPVAADNSNIGPSAEELQSFHARRRWAKVGWVYLSLLAIATLMVGTFVVAFLASIKDDPLEQPFRFNFAQVQPANWSAAWDLGKQGDNDPWLGGFAPGAELTFELTYAAEDEAKLVAPKVSVPRRKPGSGMAAAIFTDFAADYAEVSEPQLVAEKTGVSFEKKVRTEYVVAEGTARTWRYTVRYIGDGPEIPRTPLTSEANRDMTLVHSTLAPTRFERRGRIASWDNVAPGAIGYIFKNYVRVYTELADLDTKKSYFMSWTINSFMIALGRVIMTVVIACMAGYALARLQFRGSRALFALLLLSMMVPGQVTFISNYLVMRDINLLNTPWAVILVIITSAQVLIMKQFFESVPREIEEAAIVDGATPFTILWKIVMPMAKPAIASITILGFQGAWNDFFWPMVLINSPREAFTLPVGLLSLREAYGQAGDWGLILAGSFLSMIPILILFIVFQRYFVDTGVSSGVKG